MHMRLQRLTRQALVGLPLALHGPMPRGDHAFAHRLADLPRSRLQQFVCRERGHLHMQVDAVQQGATELALIA
jgi:hypothetical protein